LSSLLDSSSDTRVQAIQLSPYHPGLAVPALERFQCISAIPAMLLSLLPFGCGVVTPHEVGPVTQGSHALSLLCYTGIRPHRETAHRELKLTLSKEKTLITHAADEKANFLGYEIKVIRQGSLISEDGRRTRNGCVSLLMPRKVVLKYRKRYSKNGKVTHRAELLSDKVYTTFQRYQGILMGVYNYWCMASNVGKRMSRIKWILQTSLLRTLASKFKTKMRKIIKKYRVPDQEPTTFG
jgi:hypothetical protein